mmetsp:Transcript_41683/g.75694  ORF Transcript_41683/g.75694 Transcript_41683/m.75694 type:complete len:446 (+) Transcript_41683:18-1355(+)
MAAARVATFNAPGPPPVGEVNSNDTRCSHCIFSAVVRARRTLARLLGSCFGLGGRQLINQPAPSNARQRRYQERPSEVSSTTDGPAAIRSPSEIGGWARAESSRLLRSLTPTRVAAVDPPQQTIPAPASGQFQADPLEKLRRFQWFIDACRAHSRGEQIDPQISLKVLARDAALSVWLAKVTDSPLPCVCSQTTLQNVSCEAVLTAMYNKQDRMSWDSKSFATYERLQEGMLLPSRAFADVIYCRMLAPTGLTDRDAVQERFLFSVAGGFAIIMCAASNAHSASLGKPVGGHGAIRATTILSGYLITGNQSGGVEIAAASHADFGGGIPAFAQQVVMKQSKRRLANWAERLENYCKSELAHCEVPFGELKAAMEELLGQPSASSTSADAPGADSSRASISCELVDGEKAVLLAGDTWRLPMAFVTFVLLALILDHWLRMNFEHRQ